MPGRVYAGVAIASCSQIALQHGFSRALEDDGKSQEVGSGGYCRVSTPLRLVKRNGDLEAWSQSVH